jgi:filamentous hemagglutinin family protein
MLKPSVFVAFGFVSGLLTVSQTADAQNVVVPDQTLGGESSIVQPQTLPTGSGDAITGGATRGENLFHSFSQFNIGNGLSAEFVVTPQIQNIFARVTGNDPSQIQGTIGTQINDNGTVLPSTANLFLLNSNGIVFGPNAKLNLAGSFLATTANRFRFPDGQEFSAINPQAAPVLNVSVPIGLQYGSTVGDITITGARFNTTYRQSLGFLGGNVNISNSTISTISGQFEIGAIGPNQTVNIIPKSIGWSADYNNVSQFQNIQANNSIVGAGAVRDTQVIPSDLRLQGQQINLSNNSRVQYTYRESGVTDLIPGKIEINASGELALSRSEIFSSTDGTVPTANVEINAAKLSLNDGSLISTNLAGKGLGGEINIQVRDDITLQDSANGNTAIFIRNTANLGEADSNLRITAGSLQILDGSFIVTAVTGAGKTGNIEINLRDNLTISGSASESNARAGRLWILVFPTASGSSGNIQVRARNLNLINGGSININDSGSKNSGNIDIKLENQALISGQTPDGLGSYIAYETVRPANRTPQANLTGSEGRIQIKTRSLILSNGGYISTENIVNSDSKDIFIEATDSIIIRGIATIFDEETAAPRLFAASKISTKKNNGLGNAGDIVIRTRNLEVLEGGSISSDITTIDFSRGVIGIPKTSPNLFQGKSGDITITAGGTVTIDGYSRLPFLGSNDAYQSSAITSDANSDSFAQGGKVTVQTQDLRITNGGRLQTALYGKGQAGDMEVWASGSILVAGFGETPNKSSAISSDLAVGARGNGGKINLIANSLDLAQGGALFTSNSGGVGNSGDIKLDIAGDINLYGGNKSGIFSGVTGSTSEFASLIRNPDRTPPPEAQGNGGKIGISANSLRLRDDSVISANNRGNGQAGTIEINLRDRLLGSDNSSIRSTSDKTSGGAINIRASGILLRDNSDILTQVAAGAGKGGDIELAANWVVLLDDSDILAFAKDGQGGDIRFNTRAFFAENYTPRLVADPQTLLNNGQVDINASGAVSGVISFPDSSYVQNSLNPLNQNVIDPNQLIAKTCIRRDRNAQGSLYVLGAGGLPDRPGEIRATQYPTGDVRDLSPLIADKAWQRGDPIVEPQGAYQLANGEWVLGQTCDDQE